MRKLSILCLLLCFISSILAQHKLETLNRGLVAMKTSSGVFISWRIPGEEWYDVKYNIYRDGDKLNSEALNVSNYSDATGTTNNNYAVSAVINGVEQTKSTPVSVWGNNYKEIDLDVPESGSTPSGQSYTYSPNDVSVADINGDGDYELFVKWSPSNAHDNSHAGYTGNVYLDAYTQEGIKLWRIDLGINVRAGAHYTQFMVYDFDGDGKVELACKTAPGTKDALGNYLRKGPAANDNDATDYRNSSGYILTGPEYLTVFNGETGEEMATEYYNPQRGNVNDWGDEYGNRVDRFLACVAYLDGQHPSIVMTRGYYAKTVIAAWDWDGTNLTKRWTFNSNDNGNSNYRGQGNHNLSVADVDEDGKDEIIFGSCTIDDDGTGLYSTKMGHGDAMHVSDLDPFRKGLEAFRCLEEFPHYGTVLHDAANGDILIHHGTSGDCGRCVAANFSNKFLGTELVGGGQNFSATTLDAIYDSEFRLSTNFRIYWDGDLLEELLDGTGISKESYSAPVFVANGVNSNNGTKATPNLSADLFGDWREEVVHRTQDNKKLRIYTTTYPTIHRNYTLMHDRQYRMAIAWQNVGYNQPPHTSYFLGEAEGILAPPPPAITNGRILFTGTDTWDNTTNVWLKDGNTTSFNDGDHIYLGNISGHDETIDITETVRPSVLSINSPENYSLNANGGKLSGNMRLAKQGKGTLSLKGDHDYSGTTKVWNGLLDLDGTLSNSPIWVNLFGEVAASGQIDKGMTMRYGAKLYIGGKDKAGSLVISDSLSIEDNTEMIFDIYDLSNTSNDTLKIKGDFHFSEGSILSIIPHANNDKELTPGEYLLITCSGTIHGDTNQIEIQGLKGLSSKLEFKNKSIYLVVEAMRSATTVYWNGGNTEYWDLASSQNFSNNSNEDIFATGDDVIFDDNAASQDVVIKEEVLPSSMLFDNNLDYTISGDGSISGNSSLTKKGSGTLSLLNINTITGKVLVEEGTLKVNYLPSAIDGAGSIGSISDDASKFILNGGTLSVNKGTTSEQAITIGTKSGTIKTNHTVEWLTKIIGNKLYKTGTGNLKLHYANTNNELIIQQGTVSLSSESALPGKRVAFEGGTLQCYDSGGSYSSSSYPLFVGEGHTGTIKLDGRCSYSNELTGSGTLNVNIPWIRVDFKGNWSNFSGQININENAWFRNYNSYGYGKAHVYLPGGSTMSQMNGQTVKFGTLTGVGTVSGASTIELGMRNEDFTFDGNLASGNIIKNGTGTLTLTEVNTANGNMTINAGGVIVKDSIGTQASGRVYIHDGAWLASIGVISKHITVKSGGVLYAGLGPHTTLAGGTTNVQSVTMEENASLSVKTNPKRSSCDVIKASTSFIAEGHLELIIARTGAYADGQSFNIVEAPSITGSFTSITPKTPGEGLEWDFAGFETTGIVKVVTSTGLQANKLSELDLYPNPTKGIFTINNAQNLDNVYLQVFSLDGRVIYSKQYNTAQTEFTVDLSRKVAGTYIVRLKANDKVTLGRVVLD